MKLTPEDTGLFYRLMWSLQQYVNARRQVHPDVRTVGEYGELGLPEKEPVRDALYEDIDVIDAFVQDNPQELSDEELAVVASWKSFIGGRFIVERLLKRYAVFILGEAVYGVLGLTEPVDEVLAPLEPPVYVEAVLLPFKGQIIYDGLIRKYNISFGAGARRTFKETYMTARQNRRIITTLDAEKRQEQRKEREQSFRDYTDDLAELARAARKLHGGRTQPAIYTPAFKLVRESIKFAQAAVDDPKDVDSLVEAFNKLASTLERAGLVIDRTEA